MTRQSEMHPPLSAGWELHCRGHGGGSLAALEEGR